MKGDAASNEVI